MNFHDRIDVIAGLIAIAMFIAAVVKFFSIEEKDRNRYLKTATYLAIFCCCLVFLFSLGKRWLPSLSGSSSSQIETTPEDSTLGEDLSASTFDHEFNGQQAGEQKTLGSMNLKVCWCPPGRFTMGSPIGEKDRYSEEDQVRVTLTNGFWLGQHEVTQGLWQKVMSTTPWKGKSFVKEGANYAASYISYDDAVKFCEKLTQRGHQEGWLPKDWKVTLPTEAQWEYACRAGTTTAYHFGNDASQLGAYAWYHDNADDVDEKYAHEVGQKKPNAWNLYDMHGNVYEWCLDWYDEDLPGGVDPEVTKKSRRRVLRGGGWFINSRACRSASRYNYTPEFRFNDLGFRLAAVQSSPIEPDPTGGQEP